MSLDTTNDKPAKKKAPAKAAGNGAASAAGLRPLVEALRSTLAGDASARVVTDKLNGDAAEVAGLLNSVLDQLHEAERRKQVTSQEIDQALDALIALVRQGDLSRWNTSTEDAQLGPLLEGFGKVIETLRTFVREINEAALRLSSSSNQVLVVFI